MAVGVAGTLSNKMCERGFRHASVQGRKARRGLLEIEEIGALTQDEYSATMFLSCGEEEPAAAAQALGGVGQ
jgi:hypothetical protein